MQVILRLLSYPGMKERLLIDDSLPGLLRFGTCKVW